MSKVTVAFGSFIVGACCMFFALSGNHASIFEQPAFAQTIIGTAGVPIVPGLGGKLIDVTLEGGPQELDGLDCTRCDFRGLTLTYGGGAFKFTDSKISGTIKVVLTGAAANTVTILPFLEGLTRGTPPKPTIPQTPIEKTATAPQIVTVSFASSYGVK
jgi:hypothetical protein